MAIYLSKFSGTLADIEGPLMKLQKVNAWLWNWELQDASERVKRVMSTAPVLAKYYSLKAEHRGTADSNCSYALVAAEKPKRGMATGVISFVYRKLSVADTNYVQIERERLWQSLGPVRCLISTLGNRV